MRYGGRSAWNKTMKVISIVCVGIIVIAALVYSFSQRPRRGERINEQWETTNGTFKVRVTAFAEENGGFVGGAYYVFETSATGSDIWREIMTVRLDDPLPIPRDQVNFVTDQVGHAFMLYNYSVTVDGGVTWSVWYGPKDLPRWRDTRANIEKAQILPDGTGTMTLRSSTDQAAPELHTNDYGRHWNR